MWGTAFALANALALLMWAALILLPRWPALLAAILYLGVGLLCLTYAGSVLGLVTGVLGGGGDRSPPDFTSIEGIRTIFSTDAGITVGWIHYLAFDLFVGLWIARDADAKDFSRAVQAPVLLATFLVGPLGLVIWLALRERRARALGRWQ